MSRDHFKDAFQKKYKRTIVSPDPNNPKHIEAIPTGILALDHTSSIGGFPRGKVVEVFGPASGGKSLMCLAALAFAQKTMSATGLYFDLEGGTPESWMSTLGLDLGKTDVVQGDLSAEQNFDVLVDAIRDGGYDYIIVDSVAAMIPGAEQEGQVDQNYMATLARSMSLGMKKVVNTLAVVSATSEKVPCVIFINQVRMKPGVSFGNPETTPGGNALNFYSTQRYRVSRDGGTSGEHKVGNELVGHNIKVVNVKNKLGVPRRNGSFTVFYDRGITPVKSIMEWLKDQKAYRKEKTGYVMEFQGLAEPKQFAKVGDIEDALNASPELQLEIYNAILSRYIYSGKPEEITSVDEEMVEE